MLLPAVAYMLPQVAGADDAFVVLSGSMEPMVSPGDVIFVEDVPADSLQVGDVVTFSIRPGSKTLITHRVIEVLDAGGKIRYRTQGDANEDPDPFIVTQEMVVGTYEFHIPYWGLLMNMLRTKVGYVLFVLLPCVILILREFVNLYRELDAMERAKKAEKAAKAAEEPAGGPS